VLWMKAWLEIRWRVAFALAIALAPLVGLHFRGAGASPAEAGIVTTMIALLWLFLAVVLAGAGIRTQSPIQGTKGLHGSTQFTLSLPASRLRLLGVRASMGLAAVLLTMVVSSAAAWAFLPMIRANSTIADYIRWMVTLCCVASLFHAISILNAVYLEENWQIWGTAAVVGLLKWLTVRFPPPVSLDVFRVMARESPVSTHSLPWPAIAVSLALAGAVFLLAVKLSETHEY
jgi:hypothetical protein